MKKAFVDKAFVDKDINIFEGKEAEKRLVEKNDKKYVIENIGITKVDIERWREAQAYERKTWCDSPAKGMSTDRNEMHENHFGGYEQINFNLYQNNLNIIELGCGPFTNLRLILPKIFKTIKQVDLLDPLIKDYVQNTINCTYKEGTLSGFRVNLIANTIEQFNPTVKYDIVVMINVIEHCFNVDMIFDKINEMTKSDSLFIFHDKFLADEDITSIHDRYYDSGHPLKLSWKYIENKLKSNFSLLNKSKHIDENNELCVYQILKKK